MDDSTQRSEPRLDRRQFLAGATGVGAASVGLGSGLVGRASAQQGTTHKVAMITEGSEYIFDPVGLYIEPGDTVQFYIDSGDHSATAYHPNNPRASTRRIPEGAANFDSGTLTEKGAAYEHTFETKGTYDYYCIPHKTLGMVGRLVVGEPGGPATESPIPDKPGSGIIPPSDKIVEEKKISYPYVPDTGGGSLPGLALGGAALFALANTYLLSDYDVRSGRYSEEEFEDDTETGR